MKKILPIYLFTLIGVCAYAQTISWATYPSPAGQTLPYTYNAGTAPYNMTAVVSRNNTTLGDGTPKYVATNPGTPCYVSGSLALYANQFGNITNAFFNVNMRFNSSANGSCMAVTFTMMDINSDESNGTFLDVIEISAVDGNGVAVPVGNISITAPAGTHVANSGTTRIIRGHNNAAERFDCFYSSSPCNTTSVTITPPAGIPLQSINIRYRPAYGGNANAACGSTTAYWNFSTPRPASQYISISNLSYTTTAGCTPMPVELMNYNAECNAETSLLTWSTASELNNDYFTIEKSTDNENFVKIAIVEGAGTTNTTSNYSYSDRINTSGNSVYYRLSQTDYDGTTKNLGVRAVTCFNEQNQNITIYPNPSSDFLNIEFISETDQTLNIKIFNAIGELLLLQSGQSVPGLNKIELPVFDFPEGIYHIMISGSGVSKSQRIIISR